MNFLAIEVGGYPKGHGSGEYGGCSWTSSRVAPISVTYEMKSHVQMPPNEKWKTTKLLLQIHNKMQIEPVSNTIHNGTTFKYENC